MGEALKKKGPGGLPVWAWALILGGGAGAFLLWRKAKAKERAEQGEPILEHLNAGAPLAEGGGAGGISPETAQLRQELGEAKGRLEGNPAPVPASSSMSSTPISDFVTELGELEAAGFTRGQAAPTPGANGSQANAAAAARKAASGGHAGRGGASFRAGTYKGHAAHIYTSAVPGGVGPGRNVIVLNPSHGSTKTAHSKPPNHAPAKAKPHTQAHKQHSPPAHTVHHAAPHKPKPRPKPRPRARPKPRRR